MLTDANGVPPAVALTAENVPDVTEALRTEDCPKQVVADKAYDSAEFVSSRVAVNGGWLGQPRTNA